MDPEKKRFRGPVVLQLWSHTQMGGEITRHHTDGGLKVLGRFPSAWHMMSNPSGPTQVPKAPWRPWRPTKLGQNSSMQHACWEDMTPPRHTTPPHRRPCPGTHEATPNEDLGRNLVAAVEAAARPVAELQDRRHLMCVCVCVRRKVSKTTK